MQIETLKDVLHWTREFHNISVSAYPIAQTRIRMNGPG